MHLLFSGFFFFQEEVLGDSASSQARILASLEKQRTTLSAQLVEVQTKQATEMIRVDEMKSKTQEVKRERIELEKKISDLGVVDTNENKL